MHTVDGIPISVENNKQKDNIMLKKTFTNLK